MADNAWLTTAGENKIANALSSTTPFNITKWKVGDTENVTLDQSLTDVVGTVVDNGTTAEMSFNLISDDSIQLKVTLDESKGVYDIGNLGLFSDDDTLIAIGTYETARVKTPNAVGVVGNRLVLVVNINFVDVQSAINFNIYNTTTASWPVVQEIADLPDANLSSFEGYIVREDPSQNRAITAIRNEEPALSGNFVWTFDYHNKIAGDSSANINTIEIDTTTGEQTFTIGGTEQAKLTSSGNFGLGEPSPFGKLHITTADTGATTAVINGDELIIEGASPGMSFISGPLGAQTIYFADTDDINIGSIQYNHINDELIFRVDNQERVKITNTALELLNGTSFQFDTGTEGAPSVAAVADPDSGMYFSGSNSLGFSTNGLTRMSITDSRVDILSGADLLVGINDTGDHSLITDQGTIELTNSANPFIDFKSSSAEDFDARIIYEVLGNDFVYDVITGGEHKFRVGTIDVTTIDAVRTTSNPSTENIFSINGTNRAIINSSGINITGTTSTTTGFKANNGTASEVAYGFTNDSGNDTGMYSDGDGTLRFSANSVPIYTADSVTTNILTTNCNLPNGTVKAATLSTGLNTGNVPPASTNLIASNVILAGGEYNFSTTVSSDGITYRHLGRGGAEDGGAPGPSGGSNSMLCFAADHDQAIAFFYRTRYVSSSPPYQIGNTDYPFFAYILLDKNTKEVLGTSFAQDPTWAYNGPTDIRADRYDGVSGKSYKNRCYFCQTRKEVVREEVEVTYEFKNSDMNVIPHPFGTLKNDPNFEVILVGPDDKIMKDLIDLHEAGENLPKIFLDGYINFGSEMELSETPSGVIICEAKWKNS